MTETLTKPKKDNSKATEASRQSRAQQKADRERGRRLDEVLLPQITALNALARPNYEGPDLERVLLFLDMSREFHRGLNWSKKSIQMLDRDNVWSEAEESDEQFEDRKYLGFFVDAWISEMVRLARLVHLCPELVKFWIETLERAQEWFAANPENLEWQDEIAQELAARKSGSDTYCDPNRRPVGRPPLKQPEPFKPERQYA